MTAMQLSLSFSERCAWKAGDPTPQDEGFVSKLQLDSCPRYQNLGNHQVISCKPAFCVSPSLLISARFTRSDSRSAFKILSKGNFRLKNRQRSTGQLLFISNDILWHQWTKKSRMPGPDWARSSVNGSFCPVSPKLIGSKVQRRAQQHLNFGKVTRDWPHPPPKPLKKWKNSEVLNCVSRIWWVFRSFHLQLAELSEKSNALSWAAILQRSVFLELPIMPLMPFKVLPRHDKTLAEQGQCDTGYRMIQDDTGWYWMVG